MLQNLLARLAPLWMVAMCATSGLWSAQVAAEASDKNTQRAYEFGVFPYIPPRELEKVFAPIATEFAEALGREVRFRSSLDYETFAQNLDAQAYDIAFVHPFLYADIASQKNYLPVAARSEVLTAIVVVKPDSAIKTMADLKGATISLPPESAAVSLLTKSFLTSKGLLPNRDITYAHFKSHSSCLHQLLIGETTACGSSGVAVRFFEQKMATQLRVVAETPGIPHSLFAAHSRVPANEREMLIQRIINWQNTDKGRAIIEAGAFGAFKTTTDNDYNVVRAMSARERETEKRQP